MVFRTFELTNQLTLLNLLVSLYFCVPPIKLKYIKVSIHNKATETKEKFSYNDMFQFVKVC